MQQNHFLLVKKLKILKVPSSGLTAESWAPAVSYGIVAKCRLRLSSKTAGAQLGGGF